MRVREGDAVMFEDSRGVPTLGQALTKPVVKKGYGWPVVMVASYGETYAVPARDVVTIPTTIPNKHWAAAS